MPIITAKFSGKCTKCNRPTKAGDETHYDPETRKASHPGCAEPEAGLFDRTDSDAGR